MIALTKEQAATIDRQAVEEFGISLSLLMENAGRSVFETILFLHEEKYAQIPREDLVISMILGTGNNGADGLVTARLLMEQGYKPTILVYGDAPQRIAEGAAPYSELFIYHYNILRQMGAHIRQVGTVRDGAEECHMMRQSHIIVDGLYGTGFHGELPFTLQMVLGAVHDAAATVVSIDIPSGVNANTGAVAYNTVKADYTVTMVAPKTGMLLYPGREYVGTVIIGNIGAPPVKMFIKDNLQIVADEESMAALHLQRPSNAHKGMNGHILIVGGNKGMWGAPVMSSLASVKAGAGKTTIATREEAYDAILQKAIPEVMGQILPSTMDIADRRKGYQKLVSDKDIIAIGPGLGRNVESKDIVRTLLQTYEGPVVLDADAFYALDGDMSEVAHREIPVIMTPHVGEFSYLTGRSAKQIEADRIASAREYAVKEGVVLVLKGAPTVTAWPDGTVYINTTGNAGMAVGGSGDVLTGIIAALVGQGFSQEEAAVLGVYLHGRAADILAETEPIGYLPTEVAKYLGVAIAEIYKK